MKAKTLMKIYLSSIFAFHSAIKVQASTIPDDVIISGIGGAKLLSGRNAIDELRKRASREKDKDTAADELLKKMPFASITEQELLVAAYNKTLEAQRLAQAAGLANPKQHTSNESVKQALAQEQFAFTDLVPSSSSGNGAMVATGSDTTLKLQFGGLDMLFKAKNGGVRPLLIEAFRELAKKYAELEKASGQQQFRDVLSGRPIGSSGNVTLDLMLGSYYQAISDLEKQSQVFVAIQKAFYEVQSLYAEALKKGKEIVTIIIIGKGRQLEEVELHIEDADLDDVISYMQTAHDIVSRYKQTSFAGIEKRMRNAKSSPQKRASELKDIFDNLYVTPLSDELARLSNSEYLQQSLQLTRVFEQSMAALKATKAYPESDFTQATGVLSAAATKFANQIRENNRVTYEEYLPVLDQQRTLLGKNSADDFALLPMTLRLLQEPAAFFMLAKPSENVKILPFCNLGRITRELEYLSIDQQKALFAYLFYISDKFPEASGKYLEQTLLAATPLVQSDVDSLLEEVRQHLKSGAQQSGYTPSASDQESLKQFAVRVAGFMTGDTRTKAIQSGLEHERTQLRQLLQGINAEQLEAYKVAKQSEITDTQLTLIGRIQYYMELITETGMPTKHTVDDLIGHIKALKEIRSELEISANKGLMTNVAAFNKAKDSSGSGTSTTSQSLTPTKIPSNSNDSPKLDRSILMQGFTKRVAEVAAQHKQTTIGSDVPTPPPAPPMDLNDSTNVPPPPPPPPGMDDNSSSSGSTILPTNAVVNPLLQEISTLKAKLLAKQASIDTKLYDEIAEQIQNAENGINAGGMPAKIAEGTIKRLKKRSQLQ